MIITAIVDSTAAMGARPANGRTATRLITQPSAPVTTIAASAAAHSGMPMVVVTHQPTIAPTANSEPCAKLTTFATPITSDSPSATSA